MIKLLDLLELDIQKKTQLGAGNNAEGETYDLKSHPDKVVKVYINSNYNEKKDQYELMSKYPEFFVKIYKFTPKYVVMEKVKTPIPGVKELQKFTNNEASIERVRGGDPIVNRYSYDVVGGINQELKKDKNTIYTYILKEAKQLGKTDLVLQLTKIHDFFDKLYKTLPELKTYDLDIHDDNIGLDKQGNLKLFDIMYDERYRSE
jgi:hypothetical protein